jgi:hypothetical protein
VATRQIKDALGIPPEQKDAFSRAVKQLADLCPGEWERQGHSLIRVDFFPEAT